MTTFPEVRIEPNWPGSKPYGEGPAYMTHRGPVWMQRKGQRVRFYDIVGVQLGPEQSNVAPAVAYAHAHRWESIK